MASQPALQLFCLSAAQFFSISKSTSPTDLIWLFPLHPSFHFCPFFPPSMFFLLFRSRYCSSSSRHSFRSVSPTVMPSFPAAIRGPLLFRRVYRFHFFATPATPGPPLTPMPRIFVLTGLRIRFSLSSSDLLFLSVPGCLLPSFPVTNVFFISLSFSTLFLPSSLTGIISPR